jgi:hypothetical protein
MADINEWLETANGFSQHEDSMRVMKIGEEFGEAVAAYIGMTGQNPRKGVTHTQSDVMSELADVAITAMCAMVHFAGVYNARREIIARAHLAAKVQGIIDRADIQPRASRIS